MFGINCNKVQPLDRVNIKIRQNLFEALGLLRVTYGVRP